MDVEGQQAERTRESLLPAVTAQIYCASQGANDLISKVRDTLSMKYVTWVDCGTNIDSALTYLEDAESGHILLIEKDRPLSELLTSLDALADKCKEQTRVFVIGWSVDEKDPVATYQELQKVGVTDFILLPTHENRLRDSLIDAFQSEARPKIGTSTAVIGAGSGSGSSTIAQNMGFAMSHVLNRNTLLVDLDPQYGTLALNLNLKRPRDLLQIEHDLDSIDHKILWQSAEQVGPHLKVLPTLPDLNHAPDLAQSIICSVLEIPFHQDVHVMIDVPDPWTTSKRELLTRVDRVLIVLEPTVSGVQNLGNTKKIMEHMEINLGKVSLALNRTNQPGRTEVSLKEVEDLTGLLGIGVLPYDARLLGEADAAGVLPLSLSDKQPFSRSLIRLAKIISGVTAKDTTSALTSIKKHLSNWW